MKRLEIKFMNCPWQKWDTRGWGRFGGGWEYKLGFQCNKPTRQNGFCIILNFLFGMCRITYNSKAYRASENRKRPESDRTGKATQPGPGA